MKEKALKKINTLGKIGKIIINIGLVLTIIIAVISVLGTIGIGFIPKNFVKYEISETTKTEATIDLKAVLNMYKLDDDTREEALEKLETQLAQRAGIIQNDRGYEVTVDNDGVKMVMMDEKGHSLDVKEAALPLLVIADFTFALVIVLLVFAGKACKAFEKCESPFDDRVITAMRRFAFSLIPWVILNGITESSITSYLYGKFELDFNLDGATIAVVLVILALTYVFKYGAMLQKESDETL